LGNESNQREPALKKLVTDTISAAPIRYNIPKQNIIPQTPILPTPTQDEQLLGSERTAIPLNAARNVIPSYQQALKTIRGTGTVQYVFPHLAPNKGQSQAPDFNPKKVFRKAGYDAWEDPTLADWDPDDHRIFVGDLGNEVNDDTLFRAFSKYPTVQRARVIRDKRSGKTRGFGFVSFTDPGDFAKALREVNGKYIGNRPCKLKKSRWKDRLDDERMDKGKH